MVRLARGLTFSWSRFLGIAQARARFARWSGIPTTQGGVERKLGRLLLKLIGLR